MRVSVVIHIVGRVLRVLGAAFLAPVVVIAFLGEADALGGFLLGSLVTASAGQLMVLAGGEPGEELRRIEALAVVAGAWLLVALLGAIPYVWKGLGIVDATFESMSGFTTTGATILIDFEQLGPATMFWLR